MDAEAHGSVQIKATLEQVLRIFTNRKYLILLVFAATVASAYVTLRTFTDLYEAKAQLLFKLGRENTEVPITVGNGSVFTSGVRKEEINSSVHLLKAPDLVEAIVDQFGVDAFLVKPPLPETLLQTIAYWFKSLVRFTRRQISDLLVALKISTKLSDRERVVNGISKSIKVFRERESDVITITIRHPSPELAVRILNALLTFYLDRHVSIHQDANLRDLFVKQVQIYATRLDDLGKERETVRTSMKLTSISEERKLLLRRADELGRLVEVAERARSAIPAGNPVATTVPRFSNQLIEEIERRVAKLQLSRTEKLQTYSAGSRDVEKLDREIAALEAQAVAGLNAQIEKLQIQMVAIQGRLAELNSGENRLDRLEREIDLAKRHYRSYTERQEKVRIDREFDRRRVANVVVLSRPVLPSSPVYPRKLLVVLLSVPIGLALGIALAFLIDYVDDRVRTGDDLEGIGDFEYLGTLHVETDKTETAIPLSGKLSGIHSWLRPFALKFDLWKP